MDGSLVILKFLHFTLSCGKKLYLIELEVSIFERIDNNRKNAVLRKKKQGREHLVSLKLKNFKQMIYRNACKR